MILPDNPLRSLNRSVQAFAQRAADTVAGAVDVLNTARDSTPSDHARKALERRLQRVRKCRGAIESQFPGAVLRGFSQDGVDKLRVALYSAQKGLEDISEQAEVPDWMRSLPDEIAWSISNTLHALAPALRDDVDEESRDTVARKAQVLRGHVHEALTQATKTGQAPFAPTALLAALTLLSGGEVVAQSVTQARKLAATPLRSAGAVQPKNKDDAAQADTSSPPDSQTLSPTMALAIQTVVAAVAAGLIAKAVGNEQSLVVAWTAFVVIAGSAGLSTRRAWVRLPATILGAVVGVAIAAFVPDDLFWTVAVVAVGVFFTIVSAPVSYPAMVFWMSIAFVPLFATEGRYLDLITDKTVAALIGGCVAAVVALTIVPIRTSREIRPAVLTYLDALDASLESHLPGRGDSTAATQAELDRAHAALAATAASAASETNVFAQSERVINSEAVLVDAVHEAYLRLTPLLSDSARILHGWTDDRVETGIRRLRDAVEAAKAAPRGDATPVTGFGPTDESPSVTRGNDNTSLQLADSLRRVEDLAARLTELAQVLGGHSGLRARRTDSPKRIEAAPQPAHEDRTSAVRPPTHQASAQSSWHGNPHVMFAGNSYMDPLRQCGWRVGSPRRHSQSTPPDGRSMNDRNLQFLTIDYYQPGLRRLCLVFSVDNRTGYGPRPDDRTKRMMLSGFSTRRAVAGLIGSGAVAGAMLFGGAALAFAEPPPAPPPPPAPGCTAADLAQASGIVGTAMAQYMFSHPDVNNFFTSLRGLPNEELRGRVQAYMDANPQVETDINGIRQPVTDLRNRCDAPAPSGG